MRVVGIDLDDRSSEFGRVVAVYYTAPAARGLPSAGTGLASALGARIDLRTDRQPDAARIVGASVRAGADLCCSSFLTEIEPIGMRLVRDRTWLPTRCRRRARGRLKCCLAFEQGCTTTSTAAHR